MSGNNEIKNCKWTCLSIARGQGNKMADSDLAMQCEAQGKMIEQLKTLIREREETIKAKDKELQVSFSVLPFY